MSHLKRLRAPPTWHIGRKQGTFIARPLPGKHTLELSLPLQAIMRDVFGHVGTVRELRRLLHQGKVMVDGKVERKTHVSVGIFDVLSLPTIHEHYRMLLDTNGRLRPIIIDEKESTTKICKVTGKRHVRGGKVQLSLHDGRTLLSDGNVNVGDSVLLSLPDGKIVRTLELKNESYVYLIKGKRRGNHGTLKEVQGNKIIYEDGEKNKMETLRGYVIILGEEKPLINITYGN